MRRISSPRSGQIVLSHLVPADDPAITDEMWIEGARVHYRGPVIVGRDLIEVCATGEAQQLLKQLSLKRLGTCKWIWLAVRRCVFFVKRQVYENRSGSVVRDWLRFTPLVVTSSPHRPSNTGQGSSPLAGSSFGE